MVFGTVDGVSLLGRRRGGAPKRPAEARAMVAHREAAVGASRARREGATVLGYHKRAGGEHRNLLDQPDRSRRIRLDRCRPVDHAAGVRGEGLSEVWIAVEIGTEHRRASVGHHKEYHSLTFGPGEGTEMSGGPVALSVGEHGNPVFHQAAGLHLEKGSFSGVVDPKIGASLLEPRFGADGGDPREQARYKQISGDGIRPGRQERYDPVSIVSGGKRMSRRARSRLPGPSFENNPAPGDENLPEASGVRAVGPQDPFGGPNLDDEAVGTPEKNSFDVVSKEVQTALPEEVVDSTVVHLHFAISPSVLRPRGRAIRPRQPLRRLQGLFRPA